MSVRVIHVPRYEEDLCECLLDAFDLKGLAKLLQFKLEEKLDHAVNTDAPLSAVVLELVNWAAAHGRLGELARAAAELRPLKPRLQELAKKIASDRAAAGPGRDAPRIGAGSYRLCDRTPQVDLFHARFSENLERAVRTQVYVIHGPKHECHRSLSVRLLEEKIRHELEREPDRSILCKGFREDEPLRWPPNTKENLEAAKESLLMNLFAGFNVPWSRSRDHHAAFVEAITKSKRTTAVFYYDIGPEHWGRHCGDLIDWYLSSFFGRRVTAGETVYVLLFLHFLYPERRDRGWWGRWFRRGRAAGADMTSDEREMREYIKKLDGFAGESCHVHVLPELTFPSDRDIEDWLRGPGKRREGEVPLLMKRFKQSCGTPPKMSEVEEWLVREFIREDG